MSTPRYCKELVKRTIGRDTFQSQTYTQRCGHEVADGKLFCAKHEAQHAAEYARAKFKAEQRIARQNKVAQTAHHHQTWTDEGNAVCTCGWAPPVPGAAERRVILHVIASA